MRSTSLSVEDRLKFIEGAFQIFRFHLKQIQENNNPAITQKYKHSSIGTFIGSEIWIKRSINTCIAIAVGIKLQINGVISDLHLGRLSSHDVECFFGLLRSTSNGDERKTRLIKILSKVLITRLCKLELGLTDTKKTRVNTGGTRLSNEELQHNLNLFNSYKYVSILYGMMLNVPLSKEEIILFCKITDEYSLRIANDKKISKNSWCKTLVW